MFLENFDFEKPLKNVATSNDKTTRLAKNYELEAKIET